MVRQTCWSLDWTEVSQLGSRLKFGGLIRLQWNFLHQYLPLMMMMITIRIQRILGQEAKKAKAA
jgi:hypothetical protein